MKKQKCSVHSCEFKASKTDTLWKVDPSNTSKKPTCKYHHSLKNLMQNPILPLLTIILAYVVSIGLVSSIVSLFFLPVFLFSFITSVLIVSVFLLLIEFSVRYFFMNIPFLRRNITIKNEQGCLNSNKCLCCGKTECSGVWREYTKNLELFGTPIKTYKNGVNHYCENCYKEEFNDKDKSTSHSERNILLLKHSK